MRKRILCMGIAIMLAMSFGGCGNTSKPQEEDLGSAVETEAKEENPGSEEAEIVLRLGHINSENDPTHEQALFFADKVAEKTEGRVKVEVYPSATLGDTRELIEGLGIGTVEVVIDGFGTVETYTPVASLDAMPFLYRDYDHFMRVWQGDVGKP